MECFKESAWKSTSQVALREDACKGKRFKKSKRQRSKNREKSGPKACAESPRRVLEGVWRLIGRPSERHGARRRRRNRSEAPRDAQATPKTAEKPSQSDRKEAKSSPRPPTGNQKRAKKKENCCQEAAEGIEKGAETRKQRNVKIWFSWRRNA